VHCIAASLTLTLV
jgi:hypothetical protein